MMIYTLSLASLLTLMTAAVGVFLTGIMATAHSDSARRFAVFLGVFAFALTVSALSGFENLAVPGPYYQWLMWPNFLAGPLLYRYVKLANSRDQLIGYWHFFPAVVAGLLLSVSVVQFELLPGADIVPRYLSFLIVPHVIAYVIASLKMIAAYQTSLRDNVSNYSGVDLIWLSRVCFGLAAIVLLDFAFIPLQGIEGAAAAQTWVGLAASMYILWLAYNAVGQHFVSVKIGAEPAAEQYSRSGLSDEAAEEIADKIKDVMHRERLFLDPELTLSDLASAVNVQSHLVSEVLNKSIGQNFYEFINMHRVDAAKRLLRETNQSILDVAFESGFNNKVSFNLFFKKRAGQTPSQFRNTK